MNPPLTPEPVALTRLRTVLREMGSVLVCYSGGIDSALVLAAAQAELGERAVGLTAVSPSLSPAEKQDAERIAERCGARHVLVYSNELERPGYVANGPDRCFHCKTELYDLAEQKRVELGLAFVANGANLDDLGDYRPGLEAAKNARVRSPLLEAGMRKSDVREAALALKLDIWDKPAAACLSSRIPYGTSVTAERLQQIAGFEADLRALGFRQVRVRWHDTIARVEVELREFHLLLEGDTRARAVELGQQHGFKYVALDLGGYRTGSHNEVLIGKSLKVV